MDHYEVVSLNRRQTYFSFPHLFPYFIKKLFNIGFEDKSCPLVFITTIYLKYSSSISRMSSSLMSSFELMSCLISDSGIMPTSSLSNDLKRDQDWPLSQRLDLDHYSSSSFLTQTFPRVSLHPVPRLVAWISVWETRWMRHCNGFCPRTRKRPKDGPAPLKIEQNIWALIWLILFFFYSNGFENQSEVEQ